MSEYLWQSLVQSLGYILLGLLGWIGIRIFNKLDRLEKALVTQQLNISNEIASKIAAIQAQVKQGDDVLHARLTNLDKRVVAVETRWNYEHGKIAP